jgi:hypothetical protein
MTLRNENVPASLDGGEREVTPEGSAQVTSCKKSRPKNVTFFTLGGTEAFTNLAPDEFCPARCD